MSFTALTSLWFSVVFRRKKINPKSTTAQQTLSKCLSTSQLIHLGIGATLGAGTYVVTGQVAANIAGPAVVISFTIAALTSILSGLCYAEFGSRVPQTTGSAYTYSYVTVGEIWAFFIGWNLILEYMIGTAADAAALSGSFDYAIGFHVRNWTLENIGAFNTPYLGDYPDILSFVFTIIVTIVLAFGVRESARFTVMFNIFNIIVVIFIIVVGLFYIEPTNWTKGKGFFPYGASGVLSGAATCFYAFVGFDIIATTGEEATNPSKSIPIAIVASLVIIFTCYFGVSTVITMMIPYDELDKLSPIPAAFAQRGLGWAHYVISIGAICGLSSSLLGNLFPLPRIIYAMARDGLLFNMFTKIHEKTEVPVNATIYPGIMTAFFALLFDLEELVEMMSIGTLLAYTLVSLCVLILRYQPDEYYGDNSIMKPLVADDGSTIGSEDDDNEAQYGRTPSVTPRVSGDEKNMLETSFNENFLQLPEQKQGGHTYSPTHNPDSAENEEEENEQKLKEFKQINDGTYTPMQNDQYPGRREPTLATGRAVTCACLCLFLWFFGFNSIILFAFDQLVRKEIWTITLLIIFGTLIIASVAVIYSMPQSSTKYGFMAPCVPALPILAIYANTFLMLKLSTITWVRFGVWMVIGILLYAFYGTFNSKVDKETNDEENR
ncbi:probable cationic amino acid transporter [Clytia hemisphaerica]|uniref:probable cationic amino acid transporter n=1 Tax=Clytia hemisphaerica TaxID=252671 RepID=UPI0034D607EE|eukprot:TCONS_00051946-protein